jgi:hypothetical protein
MKIIFVDEVKTIHPPTVYFEHEYLIHHILYPSFSRLHAICLTIERDPEDLDNLEELRHLTFQESKGTREVKDIIIEVVSSSYTKPLKLWKVNIGIDDNPNLESIGDYCDEKTMTEI